MKNWKISVIGCGLLTVFAVISMVTVLGNIGVISVSGTEGAYILREHEGYVGVFYPGETADPAMVTDIRVRDLPAGDRRQLADGISAANHEEMLVLLEGLSS